MREAEALRDLSAALVAVIAEWPEGAGHYLHVHHRSALIDRHLSGIPGAVQRVTERVDAAREEVRAALETAGAAEPPDVALRHQVAERLRAGQPLEAASVLHTAVDLSSPPCP